MNAHAVPDAPFLHDRWEDQMGLEKDMLTVGRERTQSRITKAQDRQNMTGLRPYRSLLNEWVGPVSEAIRDWVKSFETARGPKPIALDRIKQVDPEVAAIVSLRAVLRMLGLSHRGLIAVAREVGTSCEHEARAKVWEEQEPEDWEQTQSWFRRRKSTQVHQRRATISLWNKYVADKVDWLDWTEEDRYRVGLELVGLVVSATRRFTIMPDPEWIPQKLSTGAYQKRPVVVMPDPELIDWLQSAMADELVHQPAWMPTVMPPQDWEGLRGGGYWTSFVKTPPLITFQAHHEETRQIALEEYASFDMGDTFDAVNFIQRTAWAINSKVLDVAQRAWENDLAIAGLPRKEAEPIREAPEDRNSEEFKTWIKEAADINSRNATRIGDILTTNRTLLLASRMADEPSFYFPHRLDFRGRMYPIPVDLSPQGWDLHRGLLTFAHGKPIEEDDEQWLAIHLANCYGIDKVSYAERIQWVTKRNTRWRQIAADPLGDRSWADEDEVSDPWQTLAAVFEWVRFLDEGHGMVSALPIRVDGTCNGIQHLSAMIRDENGGRSVNLLPSNRPRDIYQEVADLITEELNLKYQDEMARRWLEAFGGKAPRSITKRPVMILPYGGTQQAYFKYTIEWLKKYDKHGKVFDPKDRPKAATYLVPLLWKHVSGTLKKAKEVQDWLKGCAMIAAKNGLPVYWRTPAGFIVRHFYAKEVQKQIKVRIDGQTYKPVYYMETKDLDPARQARGIAPNFVHSMDASALMSCIVLAKASGIASMTVIHDSYGTVAGDMWTLSSCLREAFVQTYQQPVLEDYLRACQEAAGPGADIKWPSLPKFGQLDIEQIRHSDYFFA